MLRMARTFWSGGWRTHSIGPHLGLQAVKSADLECLRVSACKCSQESATSMPSQTQHGVYKPEQEEFWTTVPAPIAMAVWVLCSSAMVLYNKAILHGADLAFPYPLVLTLAHSVGVSVTMFVASEGLHLVASPYQSHEAGALVLEMLPIAAIFTISTWMRNTAFIYLPVSTIQIIGGLAPAVTYVISCIARMETFSWRFAMATMAMFAGVAMATFGSARAPWPGFALQMTGILLEALRGVLLKKKMTYTEDNRLRDLGPLPLLYLSAPLSSIIFLLLSPLTDLDAAIQHLRSGGNLLVAALVGNVVLAVCLNFASFVFIKKCTTTTTSVTAMTKDCILVVGCILWLEGFNGDTARSLCGYGVSIMGTVAYVGLRQSR